MSLFLSHTLFSLYLSLSQSFPLLLRFYNANLGVTTQVPSKGIQKLNKLLPLHLVTLCERGYVHNDDWNDMCEPSLNIQRENHRGKQSEGEGENNKEIKVGERVKSRQSNEQGERMVRRLKCYAKRGGARVTQVPILLFPLTTQSRLFRFILGTKCSFSLSYLSLYNWDSDPVNEKKIFHGFLHSFNNISPIPEFNENKHC